MKFCRMPFSKTITFFVKCKFTLHFTKECNCFREWHLPNFIEIIGDFCFQVYILPLVALLVFVYFLEMMNYVIGPVCPKFSPAVSKELRTINFDMHWLLINKHQSKLNSKSYQFVCLFVSFVSFLQTFKKNIKYTTTKEYRKQKQKCLLL